MNDYEMDNETINWKDKTTYTYYFIRIIFPIFGLYFDCWDEWMVSGFPDLNEVCQYNMVRG